MGSGLCGVIQSVSVVELEEVVRKLPEGLKTQLMEQLDQIEYEDRSKVKITSLFSDGYISESQKEFALASPIIIHEQPLKDLLMIRSSYKSGELNEEQRNRAVHQANRRFKEEMVSGGGVALAMTPKTQRKHHENTFSDFSASNSEIIRKYRNESPLGEHFLNLADDDSFERAIWILHMLIQRLHPYSKALKFQAEEAFARSDPTIYGWIPDWEIPMEWYEPYGIPKFGFLRLNIQLA